MTAPDGWQRVSSRFIPVDLIHRLIPGVIATVALAIPWFIAPRLAGGSDAIPPALVPWLLLLPAASAVITVLVLAWVPRRVRAIGYQLREDDLVVRRGILWHRVVAVPYGRMQLVDVRRGPVARLFGLAELRFVTAASATSATIPGLPEAEAESLRDRLVALAETRRVGL